MRVWQCVCSRSPSHVRPRAKQAVQGARRGEAARPMNCFRSAGDLLPKARLTSASATSLIATCGPTPTSDDSLGMQIARPRHTHTDGGLVVVMYRYDSQGAAATYIRYCLNCYRHCYRCYIRLQGKTSTSHNAYRMHSYSYAMCKQALGLTAPDGGGFD